MKTPPVAVSPNEVDSVVSDYVVGKILSEPAITGVRSLSAVSIYFDPGQGHTRHQHTGADQLIFIISGEAEMMIEFTEGQPQYRLIRAGDLVTIPKNAFHSTMNNSWEPVKILAVYSPAGVESGMRGADSFKVLAPGVVPARRDPPKVA
jgi:oxalate decarboxylase/phosphoglucose isomerase-like protein (cupin superfamily)